MAPSNIEKNATYLRRYLKNVYYFGYTADFNMKKSYKFGPSGSVDVVSFYYDIYESEPILWYSESNFRRRIFEVEKWAVESTLLVFASIYSFYDATRPIWHGHTWGKTWSMCFVKFWWYNWVGCMIFDFEMLNVQTGSARSKAHLTLAWNSIDRADNGVSSKIAGSFDCLLRLLTILN